MVSECVLLRTDASLNFRYLFTTLPNVVAALARASILSRCGSPPRVTWASLSRAALRAFSGSRALTAPSVTRRCCLPTRYWTIHVLLPPARILSPNPGSSSSKKITSVLPSGNLSRAMVAFVSFIGSFLMEFWEAHGKQQDASHCFPMSACEIERQRVYKEAQKFKPYLNAYDASQLLVTDECRFLLISGSKVRILVRPPIKSKCYSIDDNPQNIWRTPSGPAGRQICVPATSSLTPDESTGAVRR